MDTSLLSIFAFTILIGICVLAFFQWYDYAFLKNRSFLDIDRMSGFTFEKYLSVLFREQGYEVTVTPDRADFGADLIIRKGNISTAVQAKRYKQTVGIHAIQEIVAARQHYRCQRAMVVTNNTFTPAAWKLAMSTNVWLVDRKRLEEMMRKVKTPNSNTTVGV
jgi:restriction system protein